MPAVARSLHQEVRLLTVAAAHASRRGEAAAAAGVTHLARTRKRRYKIASVLYCARYIHGRPRRAAASGRPHSARRAARKNRKTGIKKKPTHTDPIMEGLMIWEHCPQTTLRRSTHGHHPRHHPPLVFPTPPGSLLEKQPPRPATPPHRPRGVGTRPPRPGGVRSRRAWAAAVHEPMREATTPHRPPPQPLPGTPPPAPWS